LEGAPAPAGAPVSFSIHPSSSAGARAASALAIFLAYAALQSWWLPPDGFFSGDAGTKYLQARAVVDHGPLRPWIEGPSLALDPALRWHEPFLLPRGGHLVGVFSWLLATVTALFLALFGLRGLYVVPALSVAVMFLAACAIGRAAGQRWGGMLTGWAAVLATPLLFYGAELWEHAPAVALTTTGIALLCRADTIGRRDAALSGACFVFAGTLRPEALFALPAVLIALAWIDAARVRRAAIGVTIGAGCAAAIAIAMNLFIYGEPVPPQVSSNLQAGFSYWDVRRDAVVTLILPLWGREAFVAGLVLAAAAGFATTPRARIAMVHGGVGLLLAVGLGVPLWKTFADRQTWDVTFGTVSMAHTWPSIALLACAAVARPAGRLERALLLAAGLIFALVFFTMPHTGGAQWSARFFLPVAPLAAVLAAQALERRGTRILAAVTIAASIGVQVYGVAHLRHAKRITSQIARMTASLAAPGDLVVSDLFWFPQVTATLYPTRRMLYARTDAEMQAIAAQAHADGIDRFWLATGTPKGDFVLFSSDSRRDAGLSGLTFQRFVRK
jgi:hypothetical protein